MELQGTLETKEDVSLEGKAIGDLHFDGKVGKSKNADFVALFSSNRRFFNEIVAFRSQAYKPF